MTDRIVLADMVFRARHGVAVTRSEVVGLIPLDALLDAATAFLQLDPFAPDQVLERRLWEQDT